MQIVDALRGSLAAVSVAEILFYCLAVNLVTFALYGADKRAAVRQGPRVPEKALHALALAGGTPAAWLAQRHFRHKTRKDSFQAMFWLIAAAQGLGLGMLLFS